MSETTTLAESKQVNKRGIILASREFKTKKDAIAEIRRILHLTPLGDRIEGADLDLLTALFQRHPGAAKECAHKGIVLGFIVQEHSYHGAITRGFYALHLRSTTPFSYQTCLNPELHTPDHLKVMRATIMTGQHRAKLEFFRFRDTAACPRCMKQMAFYDAHVHHLPPKFRDIASAYIAAFGEPKCESATLGDQFCDAAERERWQQFHDERAKLEVICAACNHADERKA